MSRFGQFGPQLDAMHEALADLPLDETVSELVTTLSHVSFAWPVSPVGAVNVLAGTLVAAATGMATAVGDGNLNIFEIDDREHLATAVESLRRSADVFEAMIKAGRQ